MFNDTKHCVACQRQLIFLLIKYLGSVINMTWYHNLCCLSSTSEIHQMTGYPILIILKSLWLIAIEMYNYNSSLSALIVMLWWLICSYVKYRKWNWKCMSSRIYNLNYSRVRRSVLHVMLICIKQSQRTESLTTWKCTQSYFCN